MAAETQVLLDNEKKYIAKFFSDAAESSVKKIDVSTLAWAKHTLTLSGAASPNFKIGEVITVGSAETFLVTDFTAGASTVTVVGWDNTNKKATAIDTGMSNETGISDIVALSMKGDAAGVKSAIGDALQQKVMVSLEGKKQDIAKTFLTKTQTDSKEPESVSSEETIEDGSRDTSTS